MSVPLVNDHLERHVLETSPKSPCEQTARPTREGCFAFMAQLTNWLLSLGDGGSLTSKLLTTVFKVSELLRLKIGWVEFFYLLQSSADRLYK